MELMDLDDPTRVHVYRYSGGLGHTPVHVPPSVANTDTDMAEVVKRTEKKKDETKKDEKKDLEACGQFLIDRPGTKCFDRSQGLAYAWY